MRRPCLGGHCAYALGSNPRIIFSGIKHSSSAVLLANMSWRKKMTVSFEDFEAVVCASHRESHGSPPSTKVPPIRITVEGARFLT